MNHTSTSIYAPAHAVSSIRAPAFLWGPPQRPSPSMMSLYENSGLRDSGCGWGRCATANGGQALHSRCDRSARRRSTGSHNVIPQSDYWLMEVADAWTASSTAEIESLAHVGGFRAKTPRYGFIYHDGEVAALREVLPRIQGVEEPVLAHWAVRLAPNLVPPASRLEKLRIDRMQISGKDIEDWDTERARERMAREPALEVSVGSLNCDPAFPWTPAYASTALAIVCFWSKIGALEGAEIVGMEDLEGFMESADRGVLDS
ncbi:hypothetical protein DFJ74DRAFT_736206 [Hyaloraphidium curvatum]|nr:hypothetical protein DFJ74DRAFT_736206 [Hyaloraphidium curvatum]